MKKRTYTHVKELESIIISMRSAGMTRQEIADELGLTKIQIKSWVNRYNQRNKKMAEGITPKPKGRPCKYPLDSKEVYAREIARLQMENKLMKKEKKRVAAELQLHSDQSFQYTSQAYFKLTQSCGITPSMPRKGNPYDNQWQRISSPS